MKRLLPFQPYEPVANVLGTSVEVPTKPGSADVAASSGAVWVMLMCMGNARALNAEAARFAYGSAETVSRGSDRSPPRTQDTHLEALLAAAAAAGFWGGFCFLGLWGLRASGGGASALVLSSAFLGRWNREGRHGQPHTLVLIRTGGARGKSEHSPIVKSSMSLCRGIDSEQYEGRGAGDDGGS